MRGGSVLLPLQDSIGAESFEGHGKQMGNSFLGENRQMAAWILGGVRSRLKFYPLGKRLRDTHPVITLSIVFILAVAFSIKHEVSEKDASLS